MQIRIFIISIKNVDHSEVEMNRFLRSHRVLAVKKEFVVDGENSFWTFCIEYLDAVSGSVPVGSVARPKVDYKEQLQPDEFLAFSRLREWRKRVADEEAVPVYTIFTNGQLAEIVTKKVSSKSALGSIIGVGEARVTKYGDGLLSVIGGAK